MEQVPDPGDIYAWQVFENGEWGTISAFIPAIRRHAPLLTRRRVLARRELRVLAERHSRLNRLPVALHRFTYKETIA